jgi:hypothetical protein
MAASLRDAMREHLGELACEHRVRLTFRPPTTETIARLHILLRVIEMPPIRTRRDYYAGLHEFGHLAVGVTGVALHDEAAAWIWALDNARVPPTTTVWGQMVGCLAGYVFFQGHDPDHLPEDSWLVWQALNDRIVTSPSSPYKGQRQPLGGDRRPPDEED